jgi:hypothetical protein
VARSSDMAFRRPAAMASVRHPRKRPLNSGPKFREETPKKGCKTATPITMSHCTILFMPEQSTRSKGQQSCLLLWLLVWGMCMT